MVPHLDQRWKKRLRSGASVTSFCFCQNSFEWMILSAGLLSDSDINRILKNPADSIESSLYFSWERFFTSLLTEKTKDTYLQYNKRELNPTYLQDKEKRAILKLLPEHQ